ncbi:tail fiber assembly protein [Escherichia coli]|nr:hypothetical protein [Escherichia coli]EGO4967886.1 tail fiber assembly protein [Escherichia coli]EHC2517019.1 tail fiber assembly protein [Escherichia coli]
MKYFMSDPVALYDTKITSVIPDMAVEISDEQYEMLIAGQENGEIISSDSNGMPILVEPPPPTHEEMVAAAENEKKNRIEQANEYMNSRQWPGKAAMGRLTDDERAQYNAWLDYLDALEVVDTSTAPDITWPDKPE